MIAAELATMQSGARTDLAPNDAKSDAQAAALLTVPRSVRSSAPRPVKREAIPEVAEAVKAGEMSVTAAAKLAKDHRTSGSPAISGSGLFHTKYAPPPPPGAASPVAKP